MRILFFGTPDFAVPSLKRLLESKEKVLAVITQPDRVKGRGHKMSGPPVKELALSKDVPVLQPAAIRSGSFLEYLSGFRPEVIVVVAYGRIIPPAILGLPPKGCINVHGSLLPKYRGAAPIQWALIRDEKETGITTMMMDEGLDTGDILLQESTPIGEGEDARTLGIRLSELGASLLIETLKGLAEGSVRPRPQEGEPSFAPPLKKEDGRIDWSLPARSIFNLIRGTFPWPGAQAFIGGERLTIMRAMAAGGQEGPAPGVILKVSGDVLYVGTGQGILAVSEVKPEGKKAMPAAAYIRGKRLREGASFDSP